MNIKRSDFSMFPILSTDSDCGQTTFYLEILIKYYIVIQHILKVNSKYKCILVFFQMVPGYCSIVLLGSDNRSSQCKFLIIFFLKVLVTKVGETSYLLFHYLTFLFFENKILKCPPSCLLDWAVESDCQSGNGSSKPNGLVFIFMPGRQLKTRKTVKKQSIIEFKRSLI